MSDVRNVIYRFINEIGKDNSDINTEICFKNQC